MELRSLALLKDLLAAREVPKGQREQLKELRKERQKVLTGGLQVKKAHLRAFPEVLAKAPQKE